MRRFLTHLLILLMLMPGLACGPFMNASKAHAAPSMPGMENCHGMDMNAAKEKSNISGRFFFKDCLKVDLNSSGHTDLPMPDLAGKIIFTELATEVPAYSFAPAGLHAIRGPPPDWPAIAQLHPSILTTQRLRI